MTPRDFTFWLNGYLEIENPTSLSKKQLAIVREHLDLVFKAETKTAKKRRAKSPAYCSPALSGGNTGSPTFHKLIC